MDELSELSAMESALQAGIARVRRTKDEIKRAAIDRGEAVRSVTDHAVIRYLERCTPIDVEMLRNQIRQLADEATPFKNCDGAWHDSGVVLILGEDGRVITILSHEQAENYSGRKLINGERVTPSDASSSYEAQNSRLNR